MNVITPQSVEQIEVWREGPLDARPFALEEPVHFDVSTESLALTHAIYLQQGRKIAIDIEHNAGNEKLPIAQRGAAGVGALFLLDKPARIVLGDMSWTSEEIAAGVARGKWPWISPEFSYEERFLPNPDGTFRKVVVFEIHRISLTSNPATFGAAPIVKLAKNGKTLLFAISKRVARLSFSKRGNRMNPEMIAKVIANLQSAVDLLSQASETAEPANMDPATAQLAPPVNSAPATNPSVTSDEKEDLAKDGNKEDLAKDDQDEDMKKLSILKKQFAGKSAAEVEAELFCMNRAATGAAVKFTIQAKTDENVAAAIEKKLFAKDDKPAIEQFKALSVNAQLCVLSRASALPAVTVAVAPAAPTKASIKENLENVGKKIQTVRCSIAKKGD